MDTTDSGDGTCAVMRRSELLFVAAPSNIPTYTLPHEEQHLCQFCTSHTSISHPHASLFQSHLAPSPPICRAEKACSAVVHPIPNPRTHRDGHAVESTDSDSKPVGP
eukprot:3746186-Rhodomonas_salina.2